MKINNLSIFGPVFIASLTASNGQDVCVASGGQCGGIGFSGPTTCCGAGQECVYVLDYFSHCAVSPDKCVETRGQCGGDGYSGNTLCCHYDETCTPLTDSYSECTPINATIAPLDNPADNLGRDSCGDLLDQGDLSPNVDATGFAWAHGKLHLNSTTMRLHDENNELVMLKGVTSRALPTDCVDRSTLRYIVENWGINMFRTGISLDGENGIGNSPDLVRGWDEVVEITEELGIYVVLFFANIAQGDPMYYIEEDTVAESGINATAFWQEQALKYADKSHVIFELAYEPFYTGDSPFVGAPAGWDRVKEYAGHVIPAIRAVDEDVILLLPSSSWSQDFHVPYMFPLEESLASNVMYQYNFWACVHPRHMQRLNKFAPLMPIFISSMGLGDWLGDGYCTEIARSYIDLFDKYQISWNWRDLTDSGGAMASFEPDTCVLANGTVDNIAAEYPVGNDQLSCAGLIMKSYFTTGSFPAILDEPEPTCAETFKQCTSNNDCCRSTDECQSKSETFSQCVPIGEDLFECSAASEVTVLSGTNFATQNGALTEQATNERKLRNPSGEVVQLKGVTSFCHSLTMLQTLATDYGVNVFRLKLDVTNTNGQVDVDDVDAFVSECDAVGIYCVIDWHLDSTREVVNPIFFLQEAQAFFRTITQKYATKKNLFFELFNQAGGGTFDLEFNNQLNVYSYEVGSIVNEIDPDMPLILGLPGFGRDTYLLRSDMGTDSPSGTILRGLNLNSATDSGYFDSIAMYAGSRTLQPSSYGKKGFLLATEWAIGDETGLAPETTERYLNFFNLKNVSYIIDFPELCDASFDLQESNCRTNSIKAVLNNELSSLNIEASNEDTRRGEGSKKKNEWEFSFGDVVYGAGLVAIVLGVVYAIFQTGRNSKTKEIEARDLKAGPETKPDL